MQKLIKYITNAQEFDQTDTKEHFFKAKIQIGLKAGNYDLATMK